MNVVFGKYDGKVVKIISLKLLVLFLLVVIILILGNLTTKRNNIINPFKDMTYTLKILLQQEQKHQKIMIMVTKMRKMMFLI